MKNGLKVVSQYHTTDPELQVVEYIMKNCLETNLLFRKSSSELKLIAHNYKDWIHGML